MREERERKDGRLASIFQPEAPLQWVWCRGRLCQVSSGFMGGSEHCRLGQSQASLASFWLQRAWSVAGAKERPRNVAPSWKAGPGQGAALLPSPV